MRASPHSVCERERDREDWREREGEAETKRKRVFLFVREMETKKENLALAFKLKSFKLFCLGTALAETKVALATAEHGIKTQHKADYADIRAKTREGVAQITGTTRSAIAVQVDTLHPTPYTLPYTLHPTLHPTHCTLPYTLHTTHYTLHTSH